MLIPIGTDVRPRKPPVGNYLLIALNVLIFLFTDYVGGAYGQKLKFLWTLYAAVPDIGQYITYQFLHGDLLHLLGNMLFLWIFGNAVCDRMGSLGYVIFYLAGGIFAGVVFAAFNNNALLGASGAIAAVTTAFLVLFPRVRVTLLLWFFLITAFQVPALFLIVFKIILWDNVMAPSFDSGAVSNVAYSAHLGGYTFGFCIALGMLLAGALPRNQFDLPALWSRWRKRTAWAGPAGQPGTRPIHVQEIHSRPLEPLTLTPAEKLREQTMTLVSQRDLESAANRYLELIQLDPQQVLSRQAQLDVANHLAQTQRHVQAALAYESFLSAYPAASDAQQVHLLLGLIYGRYLAEFQRARAHLITARDSLTQPDQRSLAVDELRQIEARISGPAPDNS
ncbi:MAG: rhomboid family intramembrane serine protease [Planctomycetota bacterium]